MVGWDFLESVKFFYDLRNQSGHESRVEQVKAEIGQVGGTSIAINHVLALLKGDMRDPYYGEAFEKYIRFYAGMTNQQLYDYTRYLAETFGLQPIVRVVAVSGQSLEQELPF